MSNSYNSLVHKNALYIGFGAGYIISLCDCIKVFEGARIIVNLIAFELCAAIWIFPSTHFRFLPRWDCAILPKRRTELPSLLNCPINWIKWNRTNRKTMRSRISIFLDWWIKEISIIWLINSFFFLLLFYFTCCYVILLVILYDRLHVASYF